MTEIKVKHDQIQKVSELDGEPMYIMDCNFQNNFHHLILNTYGGSQVNYSQPRASLSGYTNQFNITTNEFAVSTHTSYFKYQGLFTFNFRAAGRYILRSGYWFFQKADLVKSGYIYSDKPVCISEACMNAFCIIDQTYPVYSTPLCRNENVYLQRTTFQAGLSQEYQNAHSSTWFDSGDDQWIIEWLPSDKDLKPVSVVDYCKNVVKVNTTTAGSHEVDDRGCKNVKLSAADTFQSAYIQVKKDFIIPFDLLNLQFCHEHLEYFNALNGQDVKLMIKFLNTQFAYCFDKSNGLVLVNEKDLAGNNRTGLISNTLHLMTKEDRDFHSDTNAKDMIQHKIQPYDCYYLATRANLTGRVDEPVSRNITSINDVYLFFQPTTDNEWELYRQVSTFYTPEICVALINNDYQDDGETLFPKKFNIRRQGGADRIFTEDIENLEVFRYEILRCMNYNGQRALGCTKSFTNVQEWLRKYAFIAVNVQQWNLDMQVDPVYDGIDNSGSAKVILHWNIGSYNEYQQSPDDYVQSKCNVKTNIPNYNCICFLNYDAFSIINTTSKKFSVEQDVTFSK